MDEREFLAHIYQMWSLTTGAEDHYWMPEEVPTDPTDQFPLRLFNLYAVNQNEDRKHLASHLTDEDSDFITAIHGAFPDIYRRVLEAYDEADRLDQAKDEQEGTIAEMAQELDGKKEFLAVQEEWIARRDSKISELEAKVTDERGYSVYLQCDINDLQSELSAANAEISKLKDQLERARTDAGFYQSQWMEGR